MCRFILPLFALLICGGARAEQWELWIHGPGGVARFPLAEIDSLTFHEDTIAIPMVRVPAGSFVMGDGEAICGVEERTVTLTRDFALGRYEITNAEYRDGLQWAYDHGWVDATPEGVWDAMGSGGELLAAIGDPDSEIGFADGGFFLRDAGHGLNPHHPVKEVSWFGAASFADWHSLRCELPPAYDHETWACNGGDPYGAAGFRLPTDAEWEYAAQYDDERIYPWGNNPPSCDHLNYNLCVGWTTPVGTYEGAPVIEGEMLFDLGGNVVEWCNDWWQCDLGAAPATDPAGPPAGEDRVFRGGTYYTSADLVRVAARLQGGHPQATGVGVGFRIARTVTGGE